MPRDAFADRLLRWEQLQAGMTARAADLPFLSQDAAALAALLTEVRALNTQQESLKAQLQQVTSTLDARCAEAADLESRLRASLRGKYGAKSEALETFGIKPPKTPVRRKAAG